MIQKDRERLQKFRKFRDSNAGTAFMFGFATLWFGSYFTAVAIGMHRHHEESRAVQAEYARAVNEIKEDCMARNGTVIKTDTQFLCIKNDGVLFSIDQSDFVGRLDEPTKATKDLAQ